LRRDPVVARGRRLAAGTGPITGGIFPSRARRLSNGRTSGFSGRGSGSFGNSCVGPGAHGEPSEFVPGNCRNTGSQLFFPGNPTDDKPAPCARGVSHRESPSLCRGDCHSQGQAGRGVPYADVGKVEPGCPGNEGMARPTEGPDRKAGGSIFNDRVEIAKHSERQSWFDANLRARLQSLPRFLSLDQSSRQISGDRHLLRPSRGKESPDCPAGRRHEFSLRAGGQAAVLQDAARDRRERPPPIGPFVRGLTCPSAELPARAVLFHGIPSRSGHFQGSDKLA
jgi:hypothetical protein